MTENPPLEPPESFAVTVSPEGLRNRLNAIVGLSGVEIHIIPDHELSYDYSADENPRIPIRIIVKNWDEFDIYNMRIGVFPSQSYLASKRSQSNT